jgi:hypothetical protein
MVLTYSKGPSAAELLARAISLLASQEPRPQWPAMRARAIQKTEPTCTTEPPQELQVPEALEKALPEAAGSRANWVQFSPAHSGRQEQRPEEEEQRPP